MPERRRNLVILFIVVGLIGLSLAIIASRSTKLGLDLQGGVSLVYQGKPTKQQPTITQDSLDRAVDIIRDRVDALGVAEPSISRAGRNQIEVDLPAVKDAQRAADQVGSTAQMYFYDWEKNLLDQDCKTEPGPGQRRHLDDPRPVRGGPARVQVPAVRVAQQHDPVRAALLRLQQGQQAGQRRPAGDRSPSSCGATSRAASSPPGTSRSRSRTGS